MMASSSTALSLCNRKQCLEGGDRSWKKNSRWSRILGQPLKASFKPHTPHSGRNRNRGSSTSFHIHNQFGASDDTQSTTKYLEYFLDAGHQTNCRSLEGTGWCSFLPPTCKDGAAFQANDVFSLSLISLLYWSTVGLP